MESATKSQCCFCRLPRATLECGLCSEPLCRSCVIRLDEDAFAFLVEIPEPLTKRLYCPACHDVNVEPALTQYNEILERAKNVGFWAKAYRGRVPVLRKARYDVSVAGSPDRADALLKLGFRAAEQGFNGLINGALIGKKVRRDNDRKGYQSMEWSGHGRPVEVDEEKIAREEFREAHWRVLSHR